MNSSTFRGRRNHAASSGRSLSNYAYSRGDIAVESCDFSFVADDMLNLHGMLFAVMKCDSATSFLTARPFGYEAFNHVVQPGSAVRFLAEGNYAIRGTGVLDRIDVVPDGALTPTEAAGFMPKQSARRILRDPRNFTAYRLVLREPHGLSSKEAVDIPALNCAHYLVASNTFRCCRGSVKLMASHGRVTHNRIEDIQALGIIAGAYYSQWGEAGWVEDLTIAHNTLQRIGLGAYAHSTRCFSPCAIAIFGTVAEKYRGPYAAFNRSIRISDNHIAGCSVSGIHVYAARDVVVSGNRITDVNRAPDHDVGAAWRLVANEPIQVHPDAEAVLVKPAEE